MKKKKSVIITSTLLLVSLGILVGACKHRSPHCMMSGTPEEKIDYVISKMTDELALTETQAQQVKLILNEIHTKIQVNKGTHHEMVTVIIEEIKSDEINQQKLNQLFEEKETKFKEMRSYMISKAAEIHKILTPEQRTKLGNHLEGKMEMLHERMESWH